MGKGKRQQTAQWVVFARSTLLAMGIYLLGLLLLALLLVNGTLPEKCAFPVTAVLCVLATACGGVWAARGTSLGPLPAALLVSAAFAGILVLVGLAAWERINWTGQGGVLLLCVLAGGLSAGVMGSRRGRRVKRKRK